jgi:transposase
VTSVRFVAALDQVQRFGDAAQVCSYLGLVPGEDSSSDRKRLRGITKAGSRQTRWALVQAAWSFLRWAKDHDPVLLWAKELLARRGKKIAVVALARKLAGILFALWRDQTVYQVRSPG